VVLSPSPCLYRKGAIHPLDGAGRQWRIAYTSHSFAGIQAEVRAGLGVAVLPHDIIPLGFDALGPDSGFPLLDDTKIALLKASGTLPPPVHRHAEYITQRLRRT
jgi:DNA-binding transcriptional LysR family regulator